MTQIELRAKYKMETGLYAKHETKEEVTLDEDLTIFDLKYPIKFDFEIELKKYHI